MRFCIGGLAAAACLVLCPSAGAIGPAVTPPSDQQRIERLISQLGDEDYFVRERAQQELAKIGFKAFDALSAAEEHDDIEVAARAKFLVRQMRIEWTVDSDPPEVKRLLQNYGLKDDAARLATVEQLAALEDDKGLAVLCRLVRFEKSALLAKVAALAALEGKVQKEVDWQRRESTINDSLGPSSRRAPSGCAPLHWRTAIPRARPINGRSTPRRRKKRSSNRRSFRRAPSRPRCGGSEWVYSNGWTAKTTPWPR